MPIVSEKRVTFRWQIDPECDLYTRNEFYLEFPEEIDLDLVPVDMLCRVMLLCLHPQWILLQPCRIELPFTLPLREREVWIGLLRSYFDTLEAQRGLENVNLQIEFCGVGEPLAVSTLEIQPSGRYATAVSGGKDSLVQLGMLRELGKRPIAIATTSPGSNSEDHISSRRRSVLTSLAALKDVTLIEVKSDLRSVVNNGFPLKLGYKKFAGYWLLDTFLYTASLIIAGCALGANRLFLASECEVSENNYRYGRFIQMNHFMYSGLTQKAISVLFSQYGVNYGSLIYSLHNHQVQSLLSRRYKDLRHLQFSCWKIKDNQGACSQCGECRLLAFSLLWAGGSPVQMGVDLIVLLNTLDDLRLEQLNDKETDTLWRPDVGIRIRIDRNIVAMTRRISMFKLVCELLKSPTARLFSAELWNALKQFKALKRSIRHWPYSEMPGYRAAYLDLVDSTVRDGVSRIFDQYFSRQAESDYLDMFHRQIHETQRLTAPLLSEVDYVKLNG
ncbi:hypothetical protein ACFL17_00745 [Pseudomonadota bacterium]